MLCAPAHAPYARAVVALNLRPLLMGAIPSALVVFCLARVVRCAGKRWSGLVLGALGLYLGAWRERAA